MDGLSSSRNQKPNQPRHLLAKAHGVAMQGVNCAVIWHLLTSENMLPTGRERGVVMILAWFLNEAHVSEKKTKTRLQLQDEVSHLWSLSSAQQLDQWGLCNYIWWCAAEINELCAGWPTGCTPDSSDPNSLPVLWGKWAGFGFHKAHVTEWQSRINERERQLYSCQTDSMHVLTVISAPGGCNL